MADNKKLSNEENKSKELTDEQVNDVAGGYMRPSELHRVERAICFVCKAPQRADQMIHVTIDGKRQLVCGKCASVRW